MKKKKQQIKQEIVKPMSKLGMIFGKDRIIALAGEKNTGKTNNLISLIVDYRKTNTKTPIFAYGMAPSVMDYLKTIGVRELSEMSHLIGKKDCIIVLDEFQKLKLNDRRHKDAKDKFVDFVYHDNIYVILSSPNIREFNSIIGGIVEKWLLKNVRKDLCVNGSQLKRMVEEYKGRYKSLDSIAVPIDKLLLINPIEEITVDCPYVKEADNKAANKSLF